MRPSQLPHLNSNLTDLGFIGTFTSFADSLAAASAVPSGTSSAFELYLATATGATPVQAGIEAADVSQVDPVIGDISRLFQMIVGMRSYHGSLEDCIGDFSVTLERRLRGGDSELATRDPKQKLYGYTYLLVR